ncbi:MAG: hypothetical protein OQL16_05750, partial [Gammaproteobacteria bacterium]|nr:hypothetical protein [Gammaproteobacteria bacterium]
MKRILLSSLLVGVFSSFALAATQYEPAVVLNATDILGKEFTGSRYDVDTDVHNDGRFNHFTARLHDLDTRITSNDWMVERLYEEDAIGVLREIKQSEAYKKGLDAALEAPLTLTRNTLNDPVATLESIPQGLSNLLQDVGSAISSAGSGESKGDNAMVKDLIGFNTVKRQLASELGVDVYSSNVLLQQEMDDVAWSMFAGGAVIDVALSAAPLVASLSVHLSEQANTGKLTWKIPPATLQQAMVRAVRQHGLNDQEIESLVFHKTCNLNHLSSIVTNMSALGAVKGVDKFYQQVNQLTAEGDCRTYQKTAMLIYIYHVNKLPIQRIDVYPHYTRVIDVNKTQVMVVVADYLAYRPESQLIFGSTKLANMMWLSGKVSPTAHVMLGKQMQIQQSATEQFQAPLDIVEVLMPERMTQPIAEGEETN